MLDYFITNRRAHIVAHVIVIATMLACAGSIEHWPRLWLLIVNGLALGFITSRWLRNLRRERKQWLAASEIYQANLDGVESQLKGIITRDVQ